MFAFLNSVNGTLNDKNGEEKRTGKINFKVEIFQILLSKIIPALEILRVKKLKQKPNAVL